MHFFRIIIMSLCTMPLFIFPKINYTGTESVVVISSFETKNCFIDFVVINGVTYLVKQKKEYKKQLAVVKDTLAAYIAKGLNIAHEVNIISVKKDAYGQFNSSWPATIHTLALGETIRKQHGSKYSALRIKQHWSHPDVNNQIGLTKNIITHMTWHKQLPVIVALDLLIGNSDRHCGNLCYDPASDTFCAIDMDDTFNKDLCELACNNLDEMVKGGTKVFTKAELAALAHMRNTLKFLVTTYKPYELISKLHFFARKAGFVKGNKLYNERIKRRLAAYEKNITKTHASAQRLISMLDKLVARRR